MDFLEAVRTCVNKYLIFYGRASRSEFWWFSFIYVILSWPLSFITLFVLLPNLDNRYSSVFALIMAMLQIGLLLPWISVAARRLHDLNISHKWTILLLLPVLAQVLMLFSPTTHFDIHTVGGLGLISFIASWIFYVLFMFKGTDGDNKYGSDPLKPQIDIDIFS